jgi:hypothetical protein
MGLVANDILQEHFSVFHWGQAYDGGEATSQNRVGMGVPSRRSGSFSMTLGWPSGRRAATVKFPAGVRPRSDVTQA